MDPTERRNVDQSARKDSGVIGANDEIGRELFDLGQKGLVERFRRVHFDALFHAQIERRPVGRLRPR